MPQRAETVAGYVQGMHQHWLADHGAHAARPWPPPAPPRIETRFRYNPDVKSLVAMVPAVIPLLLLLIPAMLTALSVVREKELGSIINLYVTPVTRAGVPARQAAPLRRAGDAQLPAADGCSRSPLFGVPLKGSFLDPGRWRRCSIVTFATGIGLLDLDLHAQPDRRDVRHR